MNSPFTNLGSNIDPDADRDQAPDREREAAERTMPTPETDACLNRAGMSDGKLPAIWNYDEMVLLARNLELERDEARSKSNGYQMALEERQDLSAEVIQERDNLINVCAVIAEMDIPANDVHPNVLQEFCYKCKELAQSALDSTLPHVKANGKNNDMKTNHYDGCPALEGKPVCTCRSR